MTAAYPGKRPDVYRVIDRLLARRGPESRSRRDPLALSLRRKGFVLCLRLRGGETKSRGPLFSMLDTLRQCAWRHTPHHSFQTTSIGNMKLSGGRSRNIG
jgi:hypothetical protein